jgi:hypothetical protein
VAGFLPVVEEPKFNTSGAEINPLPDPNPDHYPGLFVRILGMLWGFLCKWTQLYISDSVLIILQQEPAVTCMRLLRAFGFSMFTLNLYERLG